MHVKHAALSTHQQNVNNKFNLQKQFVTNIEIGLDDVKHWKQHFLFHS